METKTKSCVWDAVLWVRVEGCPNFTYKIITWSAPKGGADQGGVDPLQQGAARGGGNSFKSAEASGI